MMYNQNMSIEQSPLAPEQVEYRRMQSRIEKMLANPDHLESMKLDSVATFSRLGLDLERSVSLFDEMKQILQTAFAKGKDLVTTETEIMNHFANIKVGEKNLIEILDDKLAARANIIFAQVKPYLESEKGDVLDFGAGDMQVTQRLQDDCNLTITGTDVRDYRKPVKSNPVSYVHYDGKHLPFEDRKFAATLATNVLHHAGETADHAGSESNENALRELCRVTADKIVVIETVPDPAYVEKDKDAAMERTFWNDYLYNRLFHNANVPVPGRYETAEDWPQRFRDHGWTLQKVEHLQYDQPTIRDYHILYIFVPTGAESSQKLQSIRDAIA